MAVGFKIASAFVTIDPDAAGFADKLRAQLGDLTIRPRVDDTEASAKIDELKAKLASIGNPTINPKVNSSGLKEASGWMGLLIAGAVTLAPEFITAAAAVGIFGAAAAPMFYKMHQQTGLLHSELEGVKQEYLTLTAAVRPQVFSDVSIALETLDKIIPEFTGAAQAGGVAFGDFIGQFGAFLQSGQTQGFLSFLQDQAGPDLHVLGNLLQGASTGVFGLTEALNPLAKALVNTVGGVLSFIGTTAEAVPGLTQFAAAAALAGFAAVKLGEGWTALKASTVGTWVASAVGGLVTFSGAATVAAAQEGLLAAMSDPLVAAWVAQVGVGEAVTAVVEQMTAAEIGLATAQAALDAVSPWMWAIAAVAAVGALAYAVVRLTSDGQSLTQQLTEQYHATGYNIQGYNQLAVALGKAAQAQAVQANEASNSKFGNQQAQQATAQLTQAQQQAEMHARNLGSALSQLQAEYGLTRAQAINLAQAAGVSGNALAAGGTQASKALAKIRAYADAGATAASVQTQLNTAWAIAQNEAESLTNRVKALTDAYNALVSPLTSVIGDTVTWKNDNVSLATALQKSGDRTGYATAAQRAASQAMAQSVNDTLNLSEATLQNTGSASKAAGILQQEIGVLEHLGAKGAVAASLLARLKAALDALHSKTIQINVDIAQHGGAFIPGGGGNRITVPGQSAGGVAPGYAPGHDSLLYAVSPGEGFLVPEAVKGLGGPAAIEAINRRFGGARVARQLGRGNKTGQMAGGGVAAFTTALSNGDLTVNVDTLPGTDPKATAAVMAGLKTPAALKAFQDIGAKLAHGFEGAVLDSASQIRALEKEAIGDIRRYYKGAAERTMISTLRTQSAKLEHLSGQLAHVNARITAEKQYASGITQGLAGYSALSGLTSPTTGETSAQLGQSIASQLAQKLATLKTFYSLLGKLKHEGVSKALIAQVVQLGPDEGVQYAQAILSGGRKLINELNKEEQGILGFDKSIGQRAAEINYGQSITKGFLSGLEKHRAELEHEMRKLGDLIAREMARDFGDKLSGHASGHGHLHHRRHGHHGGQHGTSGAIINFNYYGTQHPTGEQKAQMMRDFGLALSGVAT